MQKTTCVVNKTGDNYQSLYMEIWQPVNLFRAIIPDVDHRQTRIVIHLFALHAQVCLPYVCVCLLQLLIRTGTSKSICLGNIYMVNYNCVSGQ